MTLVSMLYQHTVTNGEHAISAYRDLGEHAIPAYRDLGEHAIPAYRDFGEHAIPAYRDLGEHAIPAYRDLGEDVEDESQHRQVDSQPLATEPLLEVFWHREGLRGKNH